jgi:hypothetical protein
MTEKTESTADQPEKKLIEVSISKFTNDVLDILEKVAGNNISASQYLVIDKCVVKLLSQAYGNSKKTSNSEIIGSVYSYVDPEISSATERENSENLDTSVEKEVA